MSTTFRTVPGCTFAWEGGCNGSSSAAAVDGGAVVTLLDVSGNGNHANGSGGTYFAPGINGDGTQAEVFFNGAASYNLPSGVTVGNGGTANQGTIIWVQSPDATGAEGSATGSGGSDSGFPWALQGAGFWFAGTVAAGGRTPFAANIYNGSENTFPWGEDGGQTPVVMAVRFNSSATELHIGNSYVQSQAANPIGSRAGGFVGSLAGNNFFYVGRLSALLVYNVCMTDAQIAYVKQFVQDKFLSGYQNKIQAIVLGDSRTRDHNSTEGDVAYTRGWPFKCQKALGGLMRIVTNSAHTGDTVANQKSQLLDRLQYAAFNAAVTKAAGTVLIVACGEIGVNDAIAGTPGATIVASIVDLVSTPLPGVIQKFFLGTITQTTNATAAAAVAYVNAALRTPAATFGSNAANVVIVDAAADSRLNQSNTDYADPGGDGLHWSDSGYAVIAEYFTAAIRPLANPAVGGASIQRLSI